MANLRSTRVHFGGLFELFQLFSNQTPATTITITTISQKFTKSKCAMITLEFHSSFFFFGFPRNNLDFRLLTTIMANYNINIDYTMLIK